MALLYKLVDTAFQLYIWLIVIRVVLSWIKHNPYQPVIRFVYEVTEPYLRLFRGVIPPIGMIDISPLIAFLVLGIAREFVLWLLRTLFSFL
ncbi:MAG: YggT family protein [Bacillota bacterium]